MVQCASKTLKGTQCKKTCVEGSKFCAIHGKTKVAKVSKVSKTVKKPAKKPVKKVQKVVKVQDVKKTAKSVKRAPKKLDAVKLALEKALKRSHPGSEVTIKGNIVSVFNQKVGDIEEDPEVDNAKVERFFAKIRKALAKLGIHYEFVDTKDVYLGYVNVKVL